MVMKLGSEFGVEFEEYKNTEDGQAKSEAGFMLRMAVTQPLTRADRAKRFRSYLYNAVLLDPDNHLSKYVSSGNRSSDEKPLTIDMLSKSMFTCFLYREPVDDDMATETYKRGTEVRNVTMLLNMLHDLALAGWNPAAGENNDDQRRLQRLFRSKSIMAWSELLRDAVCGKLDLQDAQDRERPFYREFSPQDIERIKSVVGRLVDWSIWRSPLGHEIDRVLADNKSTVRAWMKDHGLTTGYLMGARE
jgi:hypothetical protein